MGTLIIVHIFRIMLTVQVYWLCTREMFSFLGQNMINYRQFYDTRYSASERAVFFYTVHYIYVYAVAASHCMILLHRWPQKGYGLLRYDSGKDIVSNTRSILPYFLSLDWVKWHFNDNTSQRILFKKAINVSKDVEKK